MQLRLLLCTVTILGSAGPAPAFNCARATMAVETAICADPRLKALDDRLERAYSEVKALTPKPGQSMLGRAQKAWIADREDCAGSPDGIATCIRGMTATRIDLLLGQPDSGPGVPGRIIPEFFRQTGTDYLYELEIDLLRFVDPASLGEQRLNRIADALARSIPWGPHAEEPNPYYYSGVSMGLSYASPRLISVSIAEESYTGGAHPNHGVSYLNFDMATGADLTTADFSGPEAMADLAAQCTGQIVAQKTANADANGYPYDPGTDLALQGNTLRDHTAALENWGFSETEARINFNPYVVGAYAEGYFDCAFPLRELRSMALPGAPLP